MSPEKAQAHLAKFNMEDRVMLTEKILQTASGGIRYWVSAQVDPALPWLVFLPGLTVDHGLFKHQLTYFTEKPLANCLSWDPPAHGASRPFPLAFTLDDLALWLHDILEREGVQRPVLVGQSMGGYVAQAFMELFPGQTGGFVCLDSAPLQRSYYPNWEVAFLRHTEKMYLGIPWNLLKAWSGAGVAQTKEARAYMRASMDGYQREEFCALAGHGYRILADALDARKPYEVDCPAVLVCGRKDYAGDVRAFNRKWTRGSGIPLRWVEDAGHNVNMDKPGEINQIIQDFLGQIRRGNE